MSEKKRTCLIVGGSKGIGRALSLVLQPTANVFTTSRTEGTLLWDASQAEFSVSSLPDSLDALAYCPGTIQLKPFSRFTDAEMQDDWTVNVMGAVRVIRATLPLLKRGHLPSIVLFSTVAVQQGMPFHASVAMAKGAVEGLTRALAAELAPTVRVNALAPSITDTPLAERLLASPEKKAAAAERHPLKKIGQPHDLAEAAAFLMSEKSAWITGQVISVDGGLSRLR